MLAQKRISSDVIGLIDVFVTQAAFDGQSIVDTLNQHVVNDTISYQQWWDALSGLQALSTHPHVGLLIGQCIAPEYGGVLGFLGASATTLGGAASHFERFQRLLFNGAGLELSMADDCIRGQWAPAYCEANKTSDDTLIAALVSFARRIASDESLSPRRIGFMHGQPADTSAYHEIFQCEVQFDCPALFIDIPKHYALLASQSGNAGLVAVLEQQAQTLLDASAKLQGGFYERVREYLLSELSGGDPSQEHIAHLLGVSSRTLHRRLAEINVNFASLLKEIRLHSAKELLQDSGLSMSDVAFRLGYAEQSAFTRAFRQWTGETPLSYQKKHRLP